MAKGSVSVAVFKLQSGQAKEWRRMSTQNEVRCRPVIFSAPMVRAILAGKKTQTRRIIKPQPTPWCETTWDYCGRAFCSDEEMREHLFHNVYGTKGTPFGALYEGGGDRLWVRETWAPRIEDSKPYENQHYVKYRADVKPGEPDDPTDDGNEWHHYESRWRSPIHMPRWASRITLEITDVRAQRLQEISESDAREEGVEGRAAFAELWNSIHGEGAWDANPWCWAITFKQIGE